MILYYILYRSPGNWQNFVRQLYARVPVYFFPMFFLFRIFSDFCFDQKLGKLKDPGALDPPDFMEIP